MTKLPEPEAFRFNYDGYGWDYRDNGSGSSWKEMSANAPDKEFMHTEVQLRQAIKDALEEAAKVCDDKHHTWRWDDEPDSASGPRDCAEAIRKLKEDV